MVIIFHNFLTCKSKQLLSLLEKLNNQHINSKSFVIVLQCLSSDTVIQISKKVIMVKLSALPNY